MTWRPGWLPPIVGHSAARGALVDISVGVDEESRLARSRWKAAVLAHANVEQNPADDADLMSAVDGHLRGRRPIAGRYRGDLLITFSILDDAESREAARGFAASLAAFGAGDAGSNRVEIEFYEVESRDLETLLPEHRRQHAF